MNTVQTSFRIPVARLLVLLILALASGVTIAHGAQRFEDWLAANAIPAESSRPEDLNGPLKLTNVQAYASGLNPFTALSMELPRLSEADSVTGMRFFYSRNPAAQDSKLVFEESSDIAVWKEVAPDSEQVLWTSGGVEGREAVIALNDPLLFVRIATSLLLVDITGGSLPAFTAYGPLNPASYSIGKYEVTWSEWQEVRDWAIGNGYDLQDLGEGCSGDHPVQRLNWYDVVKWCNAKSEMAGLTPAYMVAGAVYRTGEFGFDGSEAVEWIQAANGYRLPTEEEWEYAARGGQLTHDYNYSGGNTLDDVGWYSGNSGGAECALFNPGYDPTPNLAGTWPVGMKLPNELGLYDMSGNVWEWFWDPSPIVAPYTVVRGRRIGGGAWLFYDGASLIASKSSYQPQARYYYVGFRLARNHSVPDPASSSETPVRKSKLANDSRVLGPLLR